MKTLIISFLILLTFNISIQADTSAEALYDAKCLSCHIKTRPTDISSLIAPPIMGVMRHVKITYKSKEEAIEFISEYVMDPQKAKAVCMDNKIERFGLMPSQKGKLTQEELRMISEWLYDNFPPAGFRGLNQGKNKGCGN